MAEGPVTAAASDDDLLRRVARKDGEALTALFRRHYGRVYRFALHMTGSHGPADDVTQDVFLAVMRDAGRYEPGRSSVIAWLCGIARNVARQRLERDRGLLPLADPDDTVEEGLRVTPDPLGELIQATRLDELRKAILSLPLAYREVVVLCDLQELSYADAAGAIGCAVGTVRSRLHRARGLLATKLTAAAADRSPAAGGLRCLA